MVYKYREIPYTKSARLRISEPARRTVLRAALQLYIEETVTRALWHKIDDQELARGERRRYKAARRMLKELGDFYYPNRESPVLRIRRRIKGERVVRRQAS